MNPTPADEAAREAHLRTALGLPTETADEIAAITRRSAATGLALHRELLALVRLRESLEAFRAGGGPGYVHLTPRE